MAKVATKGLAVILDEGSQATRNNIQRLLEQNKESKVYELSKNGKKKDSWNKELGKKKDPEEDDLDLWEKNFKETQKQAYSRTVDYIKKVDPGYYDQIVKSNGGSTKNLDDFHDFRKVMDGFIDVIDQEKRNK